MPLANKQREAQIETHGEPEFTLEFDVFKDGELSMWAHLDHSADFEKTKEHFIAVRNHIDEFIKDEKMCPFRMIKKD